MTSQVSPITPAVSAAVAVRERAPSPGRTLAHVTASGTTVRMPMAFIRHQPNQPEWKPTAPSPPPSAQPYMVQMMLASGATSAVAKSASRSRSCSKRPSKPSRRSSSAPSTASAALATALVTIMSGV
ncbi:MAG: hypothetical protein IPK12_11405 [Gemmatimonadetes bacterium]|nr:hypothetical protein [Gemmatimonadota bacterium]